MVKLGAISYWMILINGASLVVELACFTTNWLKESLQYPLSQASADSLMADASSNGQGMIQRPS
jgi:hypothetical protein